MEHWLQRADAAHRRRPWVGAGIAAFVALSGITAAAVADEPAETTSTVASAPAPTTTTTVPATMRTAVTTVTTVTTITTAAPAAPATPTTTAPVPVPVETSDTLPSVALPTTTTVPPPPPPRPVQQPGGPPPVSSDCTEGYDPCIVPGADVDCEGTGDGPRFVRGPIYVEGADPYSLDDDANGVAC